MATSGTGEGTRELPWRFELDDLHAMLVARGDWVPLGSSDEQKPAAAGTVEAWARSADNPIGGGTASKKACERSGGLAYETASWDPASSSNVVSAEATT